MADEEKGSQGTCSDAVDWEVVSMTASIYAAAPGPADFAPPYESKDKEKDSSAPLFMSSHFVFPPMEHEGLESKDKNELENKFKETDAEPDKTLKESLISELESLRGIQFYEKDNDLSVGNIDSNEGKVLREMSLALDEQVLPASEGFHDFHAETGISGDSHCSSQADKLKPSYSPEQEENTSERHGIPCGTWWKRHAVTLYNHAKEANTFWSVLVAAALVGFAILGQRKQAAKPELQQLKLHFGPNDQPVNLTLGPMNQIKCIFTSDHQQSSPLGAAAVAAYN
ncbi:ATG8-interacting protein 1-like [Zingiber officinale]|uniref:Uncharacterized protein n=1 Tax=Zingiber officinale TaxID=94328 RepID=A0A8J5ENU0_ZINOF|nr:ATG8-interacting protein 1-like [Zingiber officinale]XP_042449733.1 ATG8-interacting protein 1-like [Zingiber officinale]KAG6468076.1 hypothetical protein ZIOFF_072644 [Zingiber officinale]